MRQTHIAAIAPILAPVRIVASRVSTQCLLNTVCQTAWASRIPIVRCDEAEHASEGIESLDTRGSHQENGLLYRLLAEYVRMAAAQPDNEWHNRVMQLDETPAKTLANLHGLLLACGWLETRVVPDAYRERGAVLGVYRPTRDGRSAVAMATGESQSCHQSLDGPWRDERSAIEPARGEGLAED